MLAPELARYVAFRPLQPLYSFEKPRQFIPPDLVISLERQRPTVQPIWQTLRHTIRNVSSILFANPLFSKAAIILVLLSLALWTALPFRRLSLAQQSVLTFSWDAASHTLVALDLAESLRRFHIGHFVSVIFAQHWWPPFYGILLSPAFLVLGGSLANASLLSCLAYIAMPATAWLLIQRIFRSRALPLWTAVATSFLFLRSPMLLEMSTWSMFENLGGFLGLLGWLAFAHREDARYARAAYLIGTSLYFTKYHYGFFLISTFFVFTLLEEASDTRRRLWLTLRPCVISKTAKIWAGTGVFFIMVRLLAEWQGFQKSEIGYLPTVPNVLYAGLVMVMVSGLYRRSSIGPIWQACPSRLRELCCCTIAPITLWLLIPANLRAWYRQTFQASEQRADVWEQISAVCTFMRNDYVFTTWALLFVVAGLALAIVTCREQKIVCGMVAYSLWPILLMSLNPFPLEARFLGCLVPTVMVTSLCGWVGVLGCRRGMGVRLGAAIMLVVIGGVCLCEHRRWHETMQQRAKYRYPYPKEETEFVAAMIASSNGQSPIVVSLPADVWVAPTIRLGLRLVQKNPALEEVVVEKRPLEELLRKNQRFDSRGVVVSCEDSAENREVLREMFSGQRLRLSPGPKLPVAGGSTREMIFARL